MKKVALIAVCGLAAGAMAQPVMSGSGGSAGVAPTGDVLWEQLPNPDVGAFVDQSFPDFLDFSTYLVSDISVGGDGWMIDSVTTFFTNANLTWPQAGPVDATLNIFKKTGALPEPGDDPAAGTAVVAEINAGVLTASGLGILLDPGEYWIGLTPALDFGVFGQEFHQASDTVYGNNTAGRNPGGGFGLGTEWFEAGPVFGGVDYEAAIVIQGTVVPAPGALALLGMGGLFCARRRR